MSDLMREQFEKKYKAPAGCRWNSMTEDYGQSWDELSGDDDIEKEIRIHNDRFLVWKASRECLVIDTRPIRIEADCHVEAGVESVFYAAIDAIHAAGVKTK